MSHKSINAALSVRLQALGLSTAYENQAFTPTNGTLYVREDYLPAQTVPVGIADDSQDDYNGVYQVTVMAPRDENKGEAYTAALNVAAQFARGLSLSYGGVDVRIVSVSQSAGSYVGDRWAIPVTVRWRAFV